MADELDTLVDESHVFTSAERLLDLINGIQFVADRSREPASVKAIRHRKPDGTWSGRSIRVHLEGGKIKIRGGSIGFTITKNGVAQPSPLAKQTKWLKWASAVDRVSDVLNFLKGSPTYFELYQAFELMRDDINQVVGQQKQQSMGWPSKANLDHFTKSANVHRHSSIKWPTGYNLENAMPLTEASQFVGELVEKVAGLEIFLEA
ncbi:MAG: hypothetical protein IPK23_07915 [Rhizobiales bacterium]|nr:hypothetical protein [Hyphomicrobiales bacterium]